MAYLLTFSCYGTHLRGDPRGSTTRRPAPAPLPVDPRLQAADRTRQANPGYSMTAQARALVLDAICELCTRRQWLLHAAHVRVEHIHVVVDAEIAPERVLTSLKAHASQRLREIEPEAGKRWTRHGSTRWLKGSASIKAAVKYVADGQGVPMALYLAPEYRSQPDPHQPHAS